MRPLSTTVTLEDATCCPIKPANAEVFFAIEVGFEAVADRLVQQHAGPAGAEHHFHLASRSSDRAKMQDGRSCSLAAKCSGDFSP